MKLFIITILWLLCSFLSTQGQSTQLTYSRVLIVDSASKLELFDKAMVWCSKSFNESKSAINVKDKESGLIAGKALLSSYYKIPRKKDSILSSVYSNYFFDWLIEIKEAKLRFSISNIVLREDSGDYPIMINDKAPIKIAFATEEKIKTEWECSKAGFIHNLDLLANSLYSDLIKKDNW